MNTTDGKTQTHHHFMRGNYTNNYVELCYSTLSLTIAEMTPDTQTFDTNPRRRIIA